MSYPMWHIRFTNARNKLGEASSELGQAASLDGDNPKFRELYDKVSKLLGKVDAQLQRNFRRGHKEGWLK